MITWRKELHFTCTNFLDGDNYYPDCVVDLILDQLDAKTKKGMFSKAKKLGWTWNDNKTICYCPDCSKNKKGK